MDKESSSVQTGKYSGAISKISFTDLLYAVVIGDSWLQIRDVISVKNYMLFLAYLMIFDDWIMYHVEVSDSKKSTGMYMATYAMDVAILVTWYLMTIAPSLYPPIFLGAISLFFGLTMVWELIINRAKLGELLRGESLGDPYLLVFFLSLLISSLLIPIPMFYYVSLGIVAFVLVKYRKWKTIANG